MLFSYLSFISSPNPPQMVSERRGPAHLLFISQYLPPERDELCKLVVMGSCSTRNKFLRHLLIGQGSLLSPKETLPVLGSFIPTYSCFTLLSPVTGSQVLVLIAVSILIFNKELIQVPKIDLSLNSTT
jgi:hypothetical protein